MKLLRGLDKFQNLPQGAVAAIGNFDGVHQGHQELLKSLKKQSIQYNQPLVVILFEPQAREFFHPENAPPRLSRLRDKWFVLQNLGVDYVFCLTFNSQLANMSAGDFAKKYLFERLNVSLLMMGEDFCFGKNREGNLNLLIELGKAKQRMVTSFSPFLIDGVRVSSTLIREALARGDLLSAQKFLGRNYHLSGRVIRGNGLARQLGFPTANLGINRKKLPLTGVYVVRVQRKDSTWFYGVANCGTRPTVDETKPLVEVHLFNFKDDLYREYLHVMFLHKLRDEVKFPNLTALTTQINIDVQNAKTFIGLYTCND